MKKAVKVNEKEVKKYLDMPYSYIINQITDEC